MGSPRQWLWQCDCGNTTVQNANKVYRGIVVSCGCWHAENASKSMRAMNSKRVGTEAHQSKQRAAAKWFGLLGKVAKPRRKPKVVRLCGQSDKIWKD